MFPQKIFLTIDDSPSCHTPKIVKYLSERNIPAIFFCRGEFIAQKIDEVVAIIENGFLVGNHSYTHPYFSTIPIKQCFAEIEKTEILIEACYQKANLERTRKIIRLPFGDRGAGKWARQAKTKEEEAKVTGIQKFLIANHFEKVFPIQNSEKFIDAYWDWDTQDYKKKWILSPKSYRPNLGLEWSKTTHECPVMLIHDFDENNTLFTETMDFLAKNNITCEGYYSTDALSN